MKKFRRKNELIEKLKTVSLWDTLYWEEVMENFPPEEVKEMREIVFDRNGIVHSQPIKDFNRPKGNFKQEGNMFSRRILFDATNIKEKDRAMLDFLFSKQEDGVIGWGEEDEEAFSYHCLMSAMEDSSESDSFYSASDIKRRYNSFFNGEDDDL